VRRICFTLQVKPDRLEEYRERHAAVWPDMLEALAATGWQNYSLFLRPDGLLVGYLEALDFETSQARLAETQASRRWEASMAGFFLDTSVTASAAVTSTAVTSTALDKRPLDEVFHLEDQLDQIRSHPADARRGEER
jgi:L-rhamnose mutarotase